MEKGSAALEATAKTIIKTEDYETTSPPSLTPETPIICGCAFRITEGLAKISTTPIRRADDKSRIALAGKIS
jgi:hypothetical protein